MIGASRFLRLAIIFLTYKKSVVWAMAFRAEEGLGVLCLPYWEAFVIAVVVFGGPPGHPRLSRYKRQIHYFGL